MAHAAFMLIMLHINSGPFRASHRRMFTCERIVVHIGESGYRGIGVSEYWGTPSQDPSPPLHLAAVHKFSRCSDFNSFNALLPGDSQQHEPNKGRRKTLDARRTDQSQNSLRQSMHLEKLVA